MLRGMSDGGTFSPIRFSEMHGTRGICLSCGLLAISPIGREGLTEAFPSYREIERMGDMDTPHSTLPACFAREYRLAEEVEQAACIRRGPPEQDSFGAVDQPIGADVKFVLEYARRCEKWTPYSLGFTPKEHADAVDQRRRVGEERKARNRDFRVIVFGIVLAAMIALVAAGIQADWIPDPPWVHSGPQPVMVTTPAPVPPTATPTLGSPLEQP